MNRTHAGQTGHRPTRKLLSCALISCLALGAIADASAQSANATLRGQVVSASAGTEVTATNVATGSVRRTQTGADGGYTLVGLEPGTYTVQANDSSQTVTLTVASTATLDLGGQAGSFRPCHHA